MQSETQYSLPSRLLAWFLGVVALTGAGFGMWGYRRSLQIDVLHQVYRAASHRPVSIGLFSGVPYDGTGWGGIDSLLIDRNEPRVLAYDDSLFPQGQSGYLRLAPGSDDLSFSGYATCEDGTKFNYYARYDPRDDSVTWNDLSGRASEDRDFEYIEGERAVRAAMRGCGVTEGDVRGWQDYLLYEVVVRTWAEARSADGDAAIRDAKQRYSIVDNTFNFEAENGE